MSNFHSLSNILGYQPIIINERIEKDSQSTSFEYIIFSKKKTYLAFGEYSNIQFENNKHHGQIIERIFTFDKEGKLNGTLGRMNIWNTGRIDQIFSFDVPPSLFSSYILKYGDQNAITFIIFLSSNKKEKYNIIMSNHSSDCE